MSRMNNAAAGLIAILAAGCGREARMNPTADKMPVYTEIAAENCIDVCEGRICYKDIKPRKYKSGLGKRGNNLLSYSIAAEGFDNFFILNGKMIFADECVFYRVSADAQKIRLEKLR